MKVAVKKLDAATWKAHGFGMGKNQVSVLCFGSIV